MYNFVQMLLVVGEIIIDNATLEQLAPKLRLLPMAASLSANGHHTRPRSMEQLVPKFVTGRAPG
jgi:hypothetical protein